LLREELQLLQEPGSYVGEVVKLMGKKKVLVKVCIYLLIAYFIYYIIILGMDFIRENFKECSLYK
jgi:hypothetical protein